MTVLARVYLVRHGETDENRDKIIQGQLDTRLNSMGLRQARLVGEALRSVPFEIAFSSDLTRATTTAETILAHHPNVRLQRQPELRERYMGELQGKVVQTKLQAGASADQSMESGAFFAARAESWWITYILEGTASLPKKSEPYHILATTHGGFIGTLRAAAVVKAEHEPSWTASYKWFLFGSYLNVLLLFVPLSFISHHLNWDAALRFTFSFMAIIPLAKLLGEATDQMSAKLGETLAGLLNASFGNAVEIIVGVAALLRDELRIVQTSMLGSILSNILLVLGCAFIAAGFKFKESTFHVTGTQASASFMTLACITLVIPAAYHATQNGEGIAAEAGLLVISRGTAMLLLAVYIAYLFFQLKTHPELFEPEDKPEEEEPRMNTAASGLALLAVTVVTSFCADYLVASIEETANRYHIPKPFIGLILLPIVSNAAEHVTAVFMALKNRMELTITVCVGSSIQIAAFVIPLLVIVGWMTGHELTLFFADFETVVFFASVLLVNTLIQDGRSNYMEGIMLIALYLVIALSFWVS
ncbi:putative calcium proton exchanger [Lyophyllum shimeji]|uniref:Vacuolar calcium ion transporter n=1 Tax=Lyophyllum shimeji TaxID=47721 RepID=A0A9P3PFY1_LYOSH|nr:putative calcium proton exchanger [Lyophyllum shimeji]